MEVSRLRSETQFQACSCALWLGLTEDRSDSTMSTSLEIPKMPGVGWRVGKTGRKSIHPRPRGREDFSRNLAPTPILESPNSWFSEPRTSAIAGYQRDRPTPTNLTSDAREGWRSMEEDGKRTPEHPFDRWVNWTFTLAEQASKMP